ncbi:MULTISPECIES: NUDIX hydrolase [unclassified Carboxydocella]|uniref:NUDIX hydrolase n=1 Tax=unclassified Carboxydocella TaxID=2685367 RepID=UPI0009C92095|nr:MULTISPECIES: NUDIX hydrolase [unclassified Carboxydocella]GAW28208.1 ADP-ribose pyrophosphatase [Carboxydocella sp. ULO1]GAW32815.1 ADP-ribose pyrophosphatase [Carboxydocella sp. JDF658]
MAKEIWSREEVVRGKKIIFSWLHSKDAVVILAKRADNKIAFVQQRRPAIDKILLELPAGGIEKGEDPLLAAQRELKEETGWTGSDWVLLTSYFPSPGITDEKMYVFSCKLKDQADQELDEGEEIDVLYFTPEEALNMIKRKEIIDGKTIIALLLSSL